ncbi:MAG: adenylate cyclase, partial [Lachnospiraceae bacterium]|nr:adenylate cyclase [Lachnospiraceae bacterium]
MEIERKFLVRTLPHDLAGYTRHQIEQAYLCTSPVVRIRRQDDAYI